ncbi:MAG TPA: serine hydrolase domain-containing protein [Candidatus Dormibacteraeota bacterium]|nr:serine hydrolase domain-containing protein [Candidatus Dormibacteraeota bacterium]
MSSGALSTKRLAHMHDVLTRYVERGDVPGYVALVSRHGAVHVDCNGYERDTIFRIASMTKPIAAAAAMILVEEGVIRLEDQVDRFLPELAEMRVLRSIESPVEDTVPAVRPITVRDVLTFTLGTGMVIAQPGTYPIQDALQRSRFDEGIGRKPAPDEYLRRLTSVPLVHQPGDVWMYNTGSDILGLLISRAANQPFGVFLRERIFDRIGMRDTGFWVADEKADRLPPAYAPDMDSGGLKLEDDGPGGLFRHPPAFESGSGGLVATIDDFLLFAGMLLDRGASDGGRILARPTVEAMTADQLPAEVKARTPWTPGWFANHSWGFGVGVVTRRFDGTSTPGAYGWSGGYGTTWRSDPAEDMVAILMTQVSMISAEGPQIYHDFMTLAYAAIDD